jgi:hypothetical protein
MRCMHSIDMRHESMTFNHGLLHGSVPTVFLLEDDREDKWEKEGISRGAELVAVGHARG